MGSKWWLFCVTLSEESKKCMRFYWRGDLYQFLCLFFGLAPTVIKLLKTSIAFLRRISTLLTIYHDDMLFNGRTAEEILKSQYLNQYQSSQFSISQLKKVLGHVGNLRNPACQIELSQHQIQSRRQKGAFSRNKKNWSNITL